MRYLMLAALAVASAAGAQQAATPQAVPQPTRAAPAGVATIGPALPGAARAKPTTTPGAVSKGAPINGVLTLYGNERCPTDNDGNEVVVCVRRSAAEQFRVPKELRDLQVTPENASWATKARATLDAGVGPNAIGSCSTVGPGGQSGCFAQSVRANRAENRARSEAEARLP
jgi:hypothetical protein